MINLHSVEGIKKAVDDGYTVCDGSDIYQVKKVDDGYIIKCALNDYCIGLTWRDGVTLNGNKFYIKEDNDE
jgi:hypothetical protein